MFYDPAMPEQAEHWFNRHSRISREGQEVDPPNPGDLAIYRSSPRREITRVTPPLTTGGSLDGQRNSGHGVLVDVSQPEFRFSLPRGTPRSARNE
jgi:hypothetical protein